MSLDGALLGPAPARTPVVTLAVLGVLALAIAAGALWGALRVRDHDQAVLGALRAQSDLAAEVRTSALQSQEGVADAFRRLRRTRARFDQGLDGLRQTLGAWPSVAGAEGPDLGASWGAAQGHLDRVLADEDLILGLRDDLQHLEPMLSDLTLASEALLGGSGQAGWSPTQAHLAYMQWVLAKRMLESLRALLQAGTDPVLVSERLKADNELLLAFGKVHNGFVIGDPSIGLERIRDAASRAALERVGGLYRRIADLVRNLLYDARSVLGARRGVDAGLEPALAALASAVQETRGAYGVDAAQRQAYLRALVAGAAAAALLLFAGAAWLARRMRAASVRVDRARAVMAQLRDDVEGLTGGAAGHGSQVDAIGPEGLGQALEAAVGLLRERLDAIRRSATDVVGLVLSTRRHTARLYAVNDEQAAHLGAVAGVARELAALAEGVATQVQEGRGLAQQAVDDAERAARVAQEGLMGLDGVRASLHDTLTPAGRLREACTTVADLAGVLEDLADQANVAALNVAIRAAREGGEERHGFTLAADDLQRLAARLGDTTQRLGELSRGMGSQAEGVLGTLEQSATGMEIGVGLMEGMAQSVAELEDCARSLAERIRGVVDASRQQAARVGALARRIELTADLGAHALHEVRVTGSVVDELAGQTSALGRAVERVGPAVESRVSPGAPREQIPPPRRTSLPGRAHAAPAVADEDAGSEADTQTEPTQEVNARAG